MIFCIEKNLNTVQKLHPLIFPDPFPTESCKRKMEKGETLLPVVFYDKDVPVGYGIVMDKQQERILHAWVGGVLPAFQHEGIISAFYRWLIELAEQKNYRFIEGNTDNYKPAMIKTLVSHGFDIIGVSSTTYGDGHKIHMRYTVHPPVKLRISITNSCNLECFFCHHEGICSEHVRPMSIPNLELLLIQAKKRNATEITITGGEPFICPEIISYILHYCSFWKNPPLIKIITNGMLLSEEAVQSLASYSGKLKVHLSIHSISEETAKKIYGKRFSLHQLENSVVLLRKYQIPFRINCTVLNGLNSSPEQIKMLIDYAIKHEAQALHFMELLITQEQKALHHFYYSSNQISCSLQETISSNFSILDFQENAKKKVYHIQNRQNGKKISVSVYRLSCRSGCQNCAEENDITIGSDFQCYPCYLQPEKTCGNALHSLEKAVSERDYFLQAQDSQYAEKTLFWGEKA